MRPNFFSSGLIFLAGLAQESWRDLAAVIITATVLCVGGAGAGRMKVDMKVVDDKLKIIDEVPSSAVEMSVKEKVIINIFFFLHIFCIR